MKRLFWAIAFLLLAAPSWALTLSGIQTQIRKNVRDTSTDTTRQRYSDATLTLYINEAQKEINTLTWCVEKSTSYALTAGTTYYNLPTDYLGVKKALFTDSAGSTILLVEVSEKVMFQKSPNFEQASTGSPFEYFTRFSPSGTNLQIAYVPIPTTSSTGTVTVDYAYQPADLSLSTDIPFDGFLHLYPYHMAIVYQVTAQLKAIEGRTDEAGAYLQLFGNAIGEMKDKNQSQPNYLPSARGAPR